MKARKTCGLEVVKAEGGDGKPYPDHSVWKIPSRSVRS